MLRMHMSKDAPEVFHMRDETAYILYALKILMEYFFPISKKKHLGTSTYLGRES